MTSLAAILGRFIGAILAECAPVIVAILKEAYRDSAEESNTPADLTARLRERVLWHKNDIPKDGRTGEATQGNP